MNEDNPVKISSMYRVYDLLLDTINKISESEFNYAYDVDDINSEVFYIDID